MKMQFDSASEDAKYAGEVVQSDLCGRLPRSIYGHKYFCTLIDQHTRYEHVVGTTQKRETASVVELYKKLEPV